MAQAARKECSDQHWNGVQWWSSAQGGTEGQMPRFYVCPGCGGPMVASCTAGGEPRWSCWAAPSCGCSDSPANAPRSRQKKPPLAAPYYVSRLTPEQQERRELRRRLGSREYNKRVRPPRPPAEPPPMPSVQPAASTSFREQFLRAVAPVALIGAIIWAPRHATPRSAVQAVAGEAVGTTGTRFVVAMDGSVIRAAFKARVRVMAVSRLSGSAAKATSPRARASRSNRKDTGPRPAERHSC